LNIKENAENKSQLPSKKTDILCVCNQQSNILCVTNVQRLSGVDSSIHCLFVTNTHTTDKKTGREENKVAKRKHKFLLFDENII
jgi:hypothetical protein